MSRGGAQHGLRSDFVESVTGFAPAFSVRETVVLLLDDTDIVAEEGTGNRNKDGQVLESKRCPHAFARKNQSLLLVGFPSSSGHAMSSSRSLFERACCFAISVAGASLP